MVLTPINTAPTLKTVSQTCLPNFDPDKCAWQATAGVPQNPSSREKGKGKKWNEQIHPARRKGAEIKLLTGGLQSGRVFILSVLILTTVG